MTNIEILKSLLEDVCPEKNMFILKNNISDDLDLITDLDFDSLQFVSLFLNIEKTYSIELSNEVYNFDNVRKLTDLIRCIDDSIEKGNQNNE